MAVTFTPDQQATIDARGSSILVSAAAGSGKTAVLVERIIQMVSDGGIRYGYRQAPCGYLYQCGGGPDEGADYPGSFRQSG